MDTQFDERWASFGVTDDFLRSNAEWLRAPRNLHGNSVRFFELAGTLISHSRFDYPLSSLAFFQAVIGLELALKIHYRSEEESLSILLARTLEDSILRDPLFSKAPAFSKRFLTQFDKLPPSRSEALVVIVPKLRNQFFHGTYLLAPEHLYLTIQMRQIADALDTRKA